MGTSTDGQLCYGILFPDGWEFPWDAPGYGDDEEDWWRDVNGWQPPYEIYTPAGEYLPGLAMNHPSVRAYYDARSAWETEHPMPFEITNVCSASSPIHLLAVPSSVSTACRGYPLALGALAHLELDVDPEDLRFFLSFIEQYIRPGIAEQEAEMDERVDITPRWYLSSYWGQ